jgi:hypothetical protein
MFVQHYLTNMFGSGKEEFLKQTMDAIGGNRMASRPNIAEEHHGILHEGERERSVREVSRLAQYLCGRSPPMEKPE